MTWRFARSFANGGFAVEADDVSRIVEDRGALAVVLANASSAPFERIAPALSRAMIDAALTAWRRGADVFAAAAHALTSSEAAGWMLFARFTTTADIAWIGLDQACVIANGAIALRTMPHSLRATHAVAPNVATRSIVRDEVAVPDAVSWLPPAGSRIACTSSSLATVDDSSLVTCVARQLSDATRCLVDLAAAAPAVAILVEHE